ncbi:MAG TPA: hypothetical protein VH562_00460 [Nitrosopumilaceae archaeon]|jgi:hypothetical protein
MAFCSGCGEELPSPDADVCTHCGRLVKDRLDSQGDKLQKKRSGWWYLLPIFFSIIGGVIAYFVLKEDDPKLAKNCLILGIIITAIGFFVGFFMGLAMSPMMGMYNGF